MWCVTIVYKRVTPPSRFADCKLPMRDYKKDKALAFQWFFESVMSLIQHRRPVEGRVRTSTGQKPERTMHSAMSLRLPTSSLSSPVGGLFGAGMRGDNSGLLPRRTEHCVDPHASKKPCV